MPAGTSGTQGDSRLAECEVLDFRRLSKDPLSLQQPYYNDHQNHGQQQMNQAAAEGYDECPEQPDEKKDDDDRFESVTRHEGTPPCFDVEDLDAGIVDANMRQPMRSSDLATDRLDAKLRKTEAMGVKGSLEGEGTTCIPSPTGPNKRHRCRHATSGFPRPAAAPLSRR